MFISPKPHVSPALAQLRHGVTACAIAVGACAILQLLVFGFVHFTEARWAQAPQPVSQPLAVVPARPAGTAAQKSEAPAPLPAIPALPRVHSHWDSSLHVVSDFAVTFGTISTIALASLVFLGVAVAAGSHVPGVDRAVSAASWSIFLAAAAIPWKAIIPSIPFPGAFGGYDAITSLSESVELGLGSPILLFNICLFMPLACLASAIVIATRFRAGVAEGIIATSVSEIDERLEREMATIRKRGASGPMAPRSVAALNQAIGDRPETPAQAQVAPPTPPPDINAIPVPTAAPAQPRRAHEPGTVRTARSWLRRLGEPDPGDALKRPI
ncbi:MAG: hypothetical protein ACKVW3_18065 [Phycisphaerales bacterium]